MKDKVREEIAKVLNVIYQGKPKPQYTKRSFINQGIDDILSIEIGGEVAEPCKDYEQESKYYGHHYCTTCHGKGKLTRPRTIGDLIEEVKKKRI
jgi:hypothetical protein